MVKKRPKCLGIIVGQVVLIQPLFVISGLFGDGQALLLLNQRQTASLLLLILVFKNSKSKEATILLLLKLKKGDDMSKFLKINSKLLENDKKLYDYLIHSRISPARRGGTFVGSWETAPEEFKKYGIILANGGMILPGADPRELEFELNCLRIKETQQRLKAEEEAEAVKKEEQERIAGARRKLLPAVCEAYRLLAENAGPMYCLQALEYGKKAPSIMFHRDRVKNFRSAYKIGLLELYPVTNTDLTFEWAEEDVDRLLDIIARWYVETEPRRNYLWSLFKAKGGVFTKKTESKYSPDRRPGYSLVSARSKVSDYVKEDTFFIGGEEVSELEREWLKSRSSEVPPPPGFYRSAGDTNDVKPVIYPGKDELVLSTGGGTPASVVWQGEPDQLPNDVGYWAVGYLNGKCIFSGKHAKGTLERSRPLFRAWNHPSVRAARALDPESTTDVVQYWRVLPFLLEEKESDELSIKEAIALGRAY